MITTTVIWPQDGITRNPTPEQGIALASHADTLCGDALAEITTVEEGDTIISTRTWPTTESANAWVEYVLSNYNVTSAVINV